jgi:hypothetical protein
MDIYWGGGGYEIQLVPGYLLNSNMAETAFWNIGVVPRKRRVFR